MSKDNSAEEKIQFVWLGKRWKKPCNMHIETEEQKKREFRSLWIQRINAGVREEGMTYSKFINGLSKSKIKLDRKVLADLAYNNPEAFKSLVKKVQLSIK